MKKTLTFGALVLACCLAAVAQTGSNPNQTPPASTPSTFPQDQTGQTPSNPTTLADPSAIPPDTNASGQTANEQAANSQATSIQGCLSQSPEGNFIIADSSGNSFQLRGDTSQLNGNVGKEVQLDGMAIPNSGSSNAGSMSSGSSQGAATQFSVSDVHKVADTCATGSSTNK
jgi:hypothetical protein